MDKKLYVVTCISNPVRYQSRYRLYRAFADYVEKSGAILYTVEQAFGDRDFEVTQADNPRHVQVRGWDELWIKEAMLNVGIGRLPADWNYVAWIDADVMFSRPDWVEETIQLLQHNMFVQMFSHAQDLGPNNEPLKQHTGFVYDWYHHPEKSQRGGYASFSHPGYAWAARREAIEYTGGLIDFGILGSGDRHMACAMISKVEHSYNNGVHPNYKALCQQWQERCNRHIKHDIGYLPTTLMHYWHGKKKDRGYSDRWKILVDHQYDPALDVYKDHQGIWQLSDNGKWGLRDDIRRYFRSRNEDSVDAE